MKKILMLLLVVASTTVAAQTETLYVAAKSGLSLREKPDSSSKLLDKILYGTKVSPLQTDEEWVPVNLEGLNGFWRKIKFNNKTGYIPDCYLFTLPPPKTSIKEMKDYLLQLSAPFGGKLIVKSGNRFNLEEGGWELHKQLYKNGAEWHKSLGYEYGSDTYFLPGLTIQQAFLLVRLIPEFKDVFGENEVFPLENKTFKKGEREYIIKVEKENYGGDFVWIKKISVEYEDGAIYNFELYQMDNQAVIFFGAGV